MSWQKYNEKRKLQISGNPAQSDKPISPAIPSDTAIPASLLVPNDASTPKTANPAPTPNIGLNKKVPFQNLKAIFAKKSKSPQ